MNILSKEDLRALLQPPAAPCVSLYMPSHRTASEAQQDPIRFKNLLREAEEQLLGRGLRTPDVAAQLEPARKLMGDSFFWRHLSDGLAVFLSPRGGQSYRLPERFPEVVVVADRFHVKPLLPLFSGDDRFYILAISQNQPRLYQGNRFSLFELELAGVPASLSEFLGESPERHMQIHTAARDQGRGGAIYHGHGGGEEEAKDRIRRYFREVDRGVREALKDAQAPLVLAGVDYLLPIYREANTYPRLSEAGITGSPEALKPQELHREAWSLLKPFFEKVLAEDAAEYRRLQGTGRTGNDVREVLPAAYQGRVQTLFVALGVQQWGTFRPDAGAVRLHAEEKPGDDDLLNLTAVHTVLNGGAVHAVDPDRVPGRTPLAAVFRY